MPPRVTAVPATSQPAWAWVLWGCATGVGLGAVLWRLPLLWPAAPQALWWGSWALLATGPGLWQWLRQRQPVTHATPESPTVAPSPTPLPAPAQSATPAPAPTLLNFADGDDSALLAQIVRQSSNAVIVTSASRLVTWVNDSFTRLTGYGLDEIRGRSPAELLQFEGSDPGVIERMRRNLNQGLPFSGLILNRGKQGQTYWVELDIQPVRDTRGQIIAFVSFQSDVTARKETEVALRESQTFLDKAGRIAGVGGWQLRLPEQVLTYSDQTARILDLEPGVEGSPIDLLGMITPEAEALLQPVLDDLGPRLSNWDVELPLRTPRGRQIWVRVVAECEYGDGGVTAVLGAIQDITANRALKAEIRRQADLLRVAIDTIDEGFVLYDPDDRLVMCNERYRQMYGTSADMLVPGQRFEDIIREGARRGQYKAAVGREEDWIQSRLRMHRDGNCTVVQHLDNGRVLRILERRMPDGHMVSFRVDITDLVRASEEAQAANHAKSEFIATISHELRTPLQSIIGFSQLGIHFAAEQPPYDQMFNDIHNGGQRMLTLVNGLLDASKLDGGHHMVTPKRQALAPLVNEVWAELTTQASQRDLRLEQHWPEPAIWGRVDAFRFQQVLRNVLANALRFAPDHSAIELQAETSPEHGTKLRIRDRGPGIPEAELEAIFLPFVQSSRTRDGSGGTGLGLHITRKLMQAHGGQIVAHNAPDGGAVMLLSLPHEPAELPATALPLPAPAEASRPMALTT